MKKNISALLIVAATAFAASATIHYTFLYDDIEYADRLYDLDLDGDNDFKFTWDGYEYRVYCLKATSYIACDSVIFNVYSPKVYSDGSALGTHWWSSSNFNLDAFVGNSKYLAVKFNSGANTYYGWIYLYEYADIMHVGGFAYEDAAGQSITIGDRGITGIAPVNAADFGLLQNAPQTIAFSDCSSYDKVRVWNTAGQQVAEIANPVAQKNYYLGVQEQVMIVTFYREEKVLLSTKYYTR